MTRRPRRWVRTTTVFAVAAVLVSAALLAWAYRRLSSGAVSLDWFEGRIEEVLDSELAPLVVDLERGSLRWSGVERPVSIRFGEARVSGSELGELATLAGLSVDLSARALLKREIVLTGLEIERLRLTVIRGRDGLLSLALGDRSLQTGTDGPVPVGSLLEPPQPGTVLGQLTHLGIQSLDFDVEDRTLGVGWGVRDAELELERNRDGVRVTLGCMPVLQKPLGRISARAEYSFPRKSLATRLEFEALEVAALSRLVSAPELAAAMKGPLRGWVEAEFSAGFKTVRTHFDVVGDLGRAAGSVNFTPATRSLHATLELARIHPWRFADVSEGLATLENVRTSVNGTVDLVMEDGILKRADIALTGDPGQLALPRVYEQPLALGATTIKGALENGLETIRLDELRTSLGESTVVLSMRADRRQWGYEGSLQAHVDRLSVGQLASYWPPNAARGARRWAAENILEGELRDLRCGLAGELTWADERRRLHARDLAASFDVHGLSVQVLAPQPPVTGVEGRGTVDNKGLNFEIDGGRLGGIEIGDTAIAIGDFDGEPVTLEIQTELRTTVATALEVLSAEPLALVDEAIVASDGVSGRAEATLRLDVPLTGSPSNQRVGVAAEATIEGLGWERAPLDLELSDGDLELLFTDSLLQIHGQVSARGVPTAVEYRRDLVDPRRQVIEARARLTREDREGLGIPDQSVINGPVTATVRVETEPDSGAKFEAEVDLRESEIDLPFSSWSKDAGDPGQATLEGTLVDGERWKISSLSISAGSLAVQARALGDLQPVRLRSLDVERFDFAKNRLRGRITRDEGEAWRSRITGDYVDIGNLPHQIAGARWRGGPGRTKSWEPPSLELDIYVDEVATNEEVILKKLSGRAVIEGADSVSLELRAETRRGNELRLDAQSRQEARWGHLVAGDAGDLIKTLDVTTLFEGGELEMIAERATAGAATVMQLNIADLGLKESPILGDILRLASLDGLLSSLEGRGLDFKSVDIGLELEDGQVQIDRGRAYGQGIAITLSGSVDLADQLIRVNGIVARMGLVQRAIGKVPGLSQVILGRRKSGLLGTQFLVSGPFAEPKVEVYPLSTLTPGILRELLGEREPKEHP